MVASPCVPKDVGSLTFEQVSELLEYFPESGRLVWKTRGRALFRSEHRQKIWNAKHAGREIGPKVSPTGYRYLHIHNKRFWAHRIAWLLGTGEWPADFIDHINGVRTDNAMSNLRSVTRLENSRNVRAPASNKSGTVGVLWRARDKRWIAKITLQGRAIYLGSFIDKALAVEARKAAQAQFGFHKNHGRFIA